jgi:hypothetical protein
MALADQKKSQIASERDEEARGLWRWLASHFDARRIVFVDESGFNTSMTRLRARAPTGSLLVQEKGLDYASGEPSLWSNLGVFRRSSKPVSSDPGPHIPPQQTTASIGARMCAAAILRAGLTQTNLGHAAFYRIRRPLWRDAVAPPVGAGCDLIGACPHQVSHRSTVRRLGW